MMVMSDGVWFLGRGSAGSSGVAGVVSGCRDGKRVAGTCMDAERCQSNRGSRGMSSGGLLRIGVR